MIGNFTSLTLPVHKHDISSLIIFSHIFNLLSKDFAHLLLDYS